jgi:sulfate adenylyltransferase subunit 1 (EFTu-like GTPase family)
MMYNHPPELPAKTKEIARLHYTLVLQDHRVPWFKDCLLSIKEFSQEQEEKNDKTDEEKMGWYENIKTAEHILETIDAQPDSPNHRVRFPVNDYKRDWLKDQFTHHRDYKLSRLERLQNKRENQLSIVGLEGDLEMINHILKIIEREAEASMNIAFTTARTFLEATDVEWW